MAITYSDYTGDGVETDFAFSFPYLEDTHVVVEVDGVDKTTTAGDFTLPTTSLVRMTVAPALAADVRVKRVSDFATDLVDFTNGSVLTEGDLDRAYQHNRYLNEEAAEGNDASMQIVGGGTDYNAANKKIVNLADPTVASDAANMDYVDTQVALSGTNLNSFDKSTHTGDNTETEFTLSFTSQVTSPEAYLVTIDGVVQTPTTAYTVSTTTNKITFTSAPPTSAAIVVVPMGTTTVANEASVVATGSTTARTLADRFADVANVLDYGVSTTASAADNTSYLQNAIDAVSTAGGGIVFIPEGTYTINADVKVKDNVILKGEGVGSIITGDATASPIEFKVIGNNSSVRNLKLLGTKGTSTNLGLKRLLVIDDAESAVAGSGPTNVLIENVYVENTVFNGLGIYGSTDVTVNNCTIKSCLSHGIVTQNSVKTFITNNRIFESTTGTLGGGNYALDMSDGCQNTFVQNLYIENCERGFKTQPTAINTSVNNVKIIGGANSTDEALMLNGVKGYFKDIFIDGHFQGTVTVSNIVQIEGSSLIIDGLKIKNINQSSHTGVACLSASSNIQIKNLAIDAILNTALRVVGNKIRIDGFYEQQSATQSILLQTDGTNPIEDFFLANAYLSDDLNADANGATGDTLKNAHIENVTIVGAGITLRKTSDSIIQNVRADKSGSRPIQFLDDLTDVKIVGCTGDAVNQAEEAFRFVGVLTRVTIMNCTAKNGDEGFNDYANDASSSDVLLIGNITHNCTSNTGGFTNHTPVTAGNSF